RRPAAGGRRPDRDAGDRLQRPAPGGHHHRRGHRRARPAVLARPGAAGVLVSLRPSERDVVPVAATVQATLPPRSRLIRPGLRRTPPGLLGWLAILGPGLIAAIAGDDAGGIATYSSVGAKFGYELLWMLLLITVSLAVVQEMCARLGAASGRGMLDLVREHFGIGWTLFAVGVVLLANAGVTISEFIGIRSALELFGVSGWLSVPVAAVALWWLVVKGSYHRVEHILLAMTLA